MFASIGMYGWNIQTIIIIIIIPLVIFLFLSLHFPSSLLALVDRESKKRKKRDEKSRRDFLRVKQ